MALRGAPRKVQSKESPLLRLPLEILQTITSCLSTDMDLLNLALSCKYLHKRVLNPDSTTWRVYFRHKYDISRGLTSVGLMADYITRAMALRYRVNFEENGLQEQLWLEVIQTMVLESLTLPLEGSSSKSYSTLEEALLDIEFLNQPKREHSSDLFCAVQLCLSALALDPRVSTCCLRTEYDLAAVYSYHTVTNRPFINPDDLDLSTLLHMRHFWQRHLLNVHEGTFSASFAQLAEGLRPKMHKPSGLDGSQRLSTSWMGYYSCIHPLPESVEKLQIRQTCADLDSHWEQVEIMTLELRANTTDTFWPQECSAIVPRYAEPGIDRFYFDGVQKVHGGDEDGAGNPLFGFIEPFAFPYGGIPGWTRICFAICEQVDATELEAWHVQSSRWVHAYEAVIIPGGRMMIGRWIDLKEPSGRGPFIFWDV